MSKIPDEIVEAVARAWVGHGVQTVPERLPGWLLDLFRASLSILPPAALAVLTGEAVAVQKAAIEEAQRQVMITSMDDFRAALSDLLHTIDDWHPASPWAPKP